MRVGWRAVLGCVLLSCLAEGVRAQTASTWTEVRDRFRATNPTLAAGQVGIDESRATEITAFLRPNPQCGLSFDQIGNTSSTPDSPSTNIFSAATLSANCTYLHEREHKRELRRDSARGATAIAQSTQADLERTLLFILRSAFVQVLQAKAFLTLAQENLTNYDQVLDVSRGRFQSGDIAQIDLDRLELQRVTYESDVQTATVNLRTAKIQLLRLLNDRTPIEQFDVVGTFDFNDQLISLDEVRKIALDTRPDLKAAIEAIDKAQTDHKLAVANGSTDPTFSVWYTHNSSTNNPFAINTVGASISIPLRIFDRNQGEKLRTQIDITRNERLRDATEAGVLSDVDSGY